MASLTISPVAAEAESCLGQGHGHGCRAPISTPARTVERADIITIGRLSGPDGTRFEILRTLKGETSGDVLVLVNPSEGNLLGFDYASLVARIGGDETLLIAKYAPGQTDTAVLYWQRASFWPHGFEHRSFASGSVASSAAFVERLLGFDAMAKDQAALIKALLDDLGGRSEHLPDAAVAYLEVGATRDLPQPVPVWLYAMATAEALANPALNEAALEAMALIAPDLPASLAAPLFLDRAKTASEDRATILRNAVWPILSARGSDVGPTSSLEALSAALEPMMPALRRADALKILSTYVSAPDLLDRQRIDEVLRVIIGQAPDEPLAGLSLADRAELWRGEVAKLL